MHTPFLSDPCRHSPKSDVYLRLCCALKDAGDNSQASNSMGPVLVHLGSVEADMKDATKEGQSSI